MSLRSAGPVREAGGLDPAFDLAVQPLEAVGGMQPGPVRLGERVELRRCPEAPSSSDLHGLGQRCFFHGVDAELAQDASSPSASPDVWKITETSRATRLRRRWGTPRTPHLRLATAWTGTPLTACLGQEAVFGPQLGRPACYIGDHELDTAEAAVLELLEELRPVLLLRLLSAQRDGQEHVR